MRKRLLVSSAFVASLLALSTCSSQSPAHTAFCSLYLSAFSFCRTSVSPALTHEAMNRSSLVIATNRRSFGVHDHVRIEELWPNMSGILGALRVSQLERVQSGSDALVDALQHFGPGDPASSASLQHPTAVGS